MQLYCLYRRTKYFTDTTDNGLYAEEQFKYLVHLYNVIQCSSIVFVFGLKKNIKNAI